MHNHLHDMTFKYDLPLRIYFYFSSTNPTLLARFGNICIMKTILMITLTLIVIMGWLDWIVAPLGHNLVREHLESFLAWLTQTAAVTSSAKPGSAWMSQSSHGLDCSVLLSLHSIVWFSTRRAHWLPWGQCFQGSPSRTVCVCACLLARAWVRFCACSCGGREVRG